MNSKVLIVGALLVLPLIAVLSVGFRFDPHTVASPLVGKEAPDFALQDMEGNLYRLSDLRGTPVVINFWATFCPPCYQEHPVFLAASRRHEDEVMFLGVIYQDTPEKISRWEAQLGSWGPSLVDDDGKVAIAYGVYGPPETFFIDRNGMIAEKVIGAVPDSFMRNVLDSLLAG